MKATHYTMNIKIVQRMRLAHGQLQGRTSHWLYIHLCLSVNWVTVLKNGTTEKARTENSAPSKMQGWKTRERKTRHQSAGVEKARKCIYSIDI